MTLFGKVLVFVNLIFSLMMATWAFGVYSNRIDWSNNPAKGDQPPGELVSRLAEVRDLQVGLGRAEANWRQARTDLLTREALRDGDRLWYVAQFEHLRTGATEQTPARTVVLVNSLPVLDPANANRPTMKAVNDRSDKPLRSLAAYNQEWENARDQVAAALAEYSKLVEEDSELTAKLIGPKGMQQQLDDERAKQAGVVAEQTQVRPLLVNTVVDSELILKRQKQMEERLRELEKPGASGGR